MSIGWFSASGQGGPSFPKFTARARQKGKGGGGGGGGVGGGGGGGGGGRIHYFSPPSCPLLCVGRLAVGNWSEGEKGGEEGGGRWGGWVFHLKSECRQANPFRRKEGGKKWL